MNIIDVFFFLTMFIGIYGGFVLCAFVVDKLLRRFFNKGIFLFMLKNEFLNRCTNDLIIFLKLKINTQVLLQSMNIRLLKTHRLL